MQKEQLKKFIPYVSSPERTGTTRTVILIRPKKGIPRKIKKERKRSFWVFRSEKVFIQMTILGIMIKERVLTTVSTLGFQLRPFPKHKLPEQNPVGKNPLQVGCPFELKTSFVQFYKGCLDVKQLVSRQIGIRLKRFQEKTNFHLQTPSF